MAKGIYIVWNKCSINWICFLLFLLSSFFFCAVMMFTIRKQCCWSLQYLPVRGKECNQNRTTPIVFLLNTRFFFLFLSEMRFGYTSNCHEWKFRKWLLYCFHTIRWSWMHTRCNLTKCNANENNILSKEFQSPSEKRVKKK